MKERETDKNLFSQVASYVRGLPESRKHTFEEDEVLAGRVAAGDDEARLELFNSVSRMVVKQAIIRGGGNEDLTMDLIGTANERLWSKGIRLYDPSVGVKFITYATRVIIIAQQEFLKDNTSFSFSERMNVITNRVGNATGQFMAAHGREPTTLELQRLTKLKRRDVLLAKEIGEHVVRSLFEEVDDEDIVEDAVAEENLIPANPDIDSYISIELDRDVIEQTTCKLVQLIDQMSKTSPKAAAVISMRIGLGVDGKWKERLSLEEIAGKLKLTKERIRQIQQKAIESVEDDDARELLTRLTNRQKPKKG